MTDKKELFIKMLEVFKKVKLYKDEHMSFIETTKIDINHNSKEIFFLLFKNGEMNQRSLAKLLGVSPQSISENIKKLIDKKLVSKHIGQLHNENIVVLTDKGYEIGMNIDKVITNLSYDLFNAFSEEELKEFSNLIKKLN